MGWMADEVHAAAASPKASRGFEVWSSATAEATGGDFALCHSSSLCLMPSTGKD